MVFHLIVIYFTAEDMAVLLPKKCLSQQQEFNQLCPRLLNQCLHIPFPAVVLSFAFPWNFLMIPVNVTRVSNIHANIAEEVRKEQQRPPQYPMETVTAVCQEDHSGADTHVKGHIPEETGYS